MVVAAPSGYFSRPERVNKYGQKNGGFKRSEKLMVRPFTRRGSENPGQKRQPR
jgi:hypothetical protein